MRLPVAPAIPDAATLWRRYADLLGDRLLATGEDAALPFGRGVTDGPDAFVLLPEQSAAEQSQAAAAHLRAGNARRVTWVVPPGVADPTGDAARRVAFTLYRLRRSTLSDADADAGRSVLPGRAARTWYERACRATEDPADPFSARRPAHLDDPQFDGMVVLDGGAAVALGGLQTRGQGGGVFDLCVVPEHRRRGLGRFLLGRVLELAARAQLSDVFAAAEVENAAATALLENAGFVRVTQYAVVTTT